MVIPVLDLAWLVLAFGGLFAGPAGLALTASAPVGIGAFAALRASRMIAARGGGPVGALQALTVACVYDLARALALVWRAPHPRGERRA
jgi:hypothetical protein